MPSDRKRVCLCGGDSSYLKRLSSRLADLADTTVVESPDDAWPSHDMLVWKLEGEIEQRRLAEVSSTLPTVVIADTVQLLEAVDAGVRGFLPPEADLDEVKDAVLTVARGGAVVPPELLGQLLRHVVQRRRGADTRDELLESLTARERDVYDLAARGVRREEIADELFISPATVRTHLQRVYRKLGVHSQTELMSYGNSQAGNDRTGEL